MRARHELWVAVGLATFLTAAVLLRPQTVRAGAPALQLPEQFIGFKVGADNRLVRWDKIVEYLKLAAATSDRVRYKELGRSTQGNPFVVLEIAAPETLKNLDRFRQLQRRLYFQDGIPTTKERDEIFRSGKAVVLVTCATHASEIGCTQAALELTHLLATDDSPAVKKILDQTIVLLVPSLNPDGQIMITDWFQRNVGTPYESSPLPFLSHQYVGHDSNRDMYMFTQKESQYAAELAWHDWFPSIWLDQHQMGTTGPRMFVMPATDPINPNVHPVIYRWAAIFGQSQAVALEATGKEGIIYNSTYTNFWEGAMAWSGWWHNQIGLLTEVASARIAAPTDQQRAIARDLSSGDRSARDGTDGSSASPLPLPPPTDTLPRTEYPRPWMGGRWTLRDIVDYETISTLALLETAADRRETVARQIYEVNRQTIDEGRTGSLKAILIPVQGVQDPRESVHLAERLITAGVEVQRAEAAFTADGQTYQAGTFVVPMTQVFARYAKDILERQIYPEVRRTPDGPAEPPYDVTGWSLGMQFGIDAKFIESTLPNIQTSRVVSPKWPAGQVSGSGPRYVFDYRGPDTAIAINRLLKDHARVWLEPSSRIAVEDVAKDRIDDIARANGIHVVSMASQPNASGGGERLRLPRTGLYSPWTGGNIDEGWTRWILEQYEFPYTTLHNKDIREGNLRRQFDAIILTDQPPREILEGYSSNTIRPEYRGGIGETGLDALTRFISEGGTLVTLGAASDLVIDRFPIPVRNLKRTLRREQHFAPGTILRLQVDPSQPMAAGVAADTYGFYNNSPFFSIVEGFTTLKPNVIARYPNRNLLASGWLRGEELMAGRAAIISIDMKPGRLVLFGLRPQHRAQTHATFPLLFNALYLQADAGTE